MLSTTNNCSLGNYQNRESINKKPTHQILFLVFLAHVYACDTNSEPDYEYRKIKIESLFSEWQPNKFDAMVQAKAELSEFAKGACRRKIRSGWSLSNIENVGLPDCEVTAKGHHCRKKEVILNCRRVSEFFP